MNVKLEVVKNKAKLSRLLQLYLHNISSDFPIDMDQRTGLYNYGDLPLYLTNSKEHVAYFIIADKRLAGFILADFGSINIVQEIFVLNNFKRQGIGEKAVNILFDEHKGNWEIKAVPCSKRAEEFWTNVVNKYTSGNFNKELVGKYNRAVITFNNSK